MNLYIGNLSRLVTEADLKMMFDGLGDIVYAKFVGFADDERARGYAFVHIADDAQASIAVSALNGKCLKGVVLTVRPVVDQALELSVLRASLRNDAALTPVGHGRHKAAHLHLHSIHHIPALLN